jgi:hypothetical protein
MEDEPSPEEWEKALKRTVIARLRWFMEMYEKGVLAREYDRRFTAASKQEQPFIYAEENAHG